MDFYILEKSVTGYKNLIKNKVDISIIVSSTGLTEDEINSLK